MTPKEKGSRSEGAIMSQLIKCGHTVLLPIGENNRYDLVIDLNGEFKRVQCKTGILRGGAIRFRPCSENVVKGKRVTYSYTGSVEFIGVYCEERDEVYLVPVAECAATCTSLRLDKSKNNQQNGVRSATQYLLVPGKWPCSSIG